MTAPGREPGPRAAEGRPTVSSAPVVANPLTRLLSGSCARQAATWQSIACAERHSLLDICRAPDLAAAVTLQPLARIDLDAAILFSDLLVPLEPMGLRLIS